MNYRRRALLIGAVLPIALATAAVVVMLTWLPTLPGSVALHWGPEGADGFGSPWLAILLPIVIVPAFAFFALWLTRTPAPSGGPTINHKILLTTSVWLGVVLSGALAGTLAIQRTSSGAAASDIVPVLLIAFSAAFLLAVPAWFALPPADATVAGGTEVPPVAIAPGEKLFWSRTIRLHRVVAATVGVAIAIASVVTILVAFLAPAGVWLALSALVAVLVLALATSYWRVTASAKGLVVRSAFGWPRVVVPAAEIHSVSVVAVDPVGDFGGWGYRWSPPGRTGIILRRGEAIEVTRTSGKRFVVTVDDATTGAGVLAAFAGLSQPVSLP